MLYIVGAGGFGRETYDAVLAARPGADTRAGEVEFVDEQRAGTTVRGLAVRALGDVEPGQRFVVAIAAADPRRRLSTACADKGLRALTIVHPRSVVGPETTLGHGCVVLALAHISSSVTIGNHVHVNYNATVGHDAVLHDFVTVLPGANVSGAVVLEEGATVGAGAVVLPGLSVGRGAMVGAGAVVTRDVPEGMTVKGVPARPVIVEQPE